jgi:Arc/MetJ family transcription regulator
VFAGPGIWRARLRRRPTAADRSRTNIEIDDECVEVIMGRFGLRTKTDAVDLALRHLAEQPMTREEGLATRGERAIGTVAAAAGPEIAS